MTEWDYRENLYTEKNSLWSCFFFRIVIWQCLLVEISETFYVKYIIRRKAVLQNKTIEQESNFNSREYHLDDRIDREVKISRIRVGDARPLKTLELWLLQSFSIV